MMYRTGYLGGSEFIGPHRWSNLRPIHVIDITQFIENDFHRTGVYRDLFPKVVPVSKLELES